jgi:hypothetical protein
MSFVAAVGLRLIGVRILQVSRHLVCCALLVSPAYGQEKSSQPEKLAYGVDKANVPDAIARVKSGDFAAVHVDLIARANAVDAIPVLKEQFNRVDDQLIKAKIAAALLRMGDKDNTYWNFLVEFANPALQNDAPDYIGYDQQGKAVPGPSPEFQAWAKAHNFSVESELDDSVRMASTGVIFLGWSRDLRAIPLLRKALLSPNHMIEIFAAMGLAEIGDKESIPLIIEACKRAPAEPAAAIAESLVYFDDITAQSAVDQFVPKDRAKLVREAKANTKRSPLSAPLVSNVPNQ